MKTYTLTGAQAFQHHPEHPERTAKRYPPGLNFDVIFKVWPSRGALEKTLELQARRASHPQDWKPCIPMRCPKCSQKTNDAGQCPTHGGPK